MVTLHIAIEWTSGPKEEGSHQVRRDGSEHKQREQKLLWYNIILCVQPFADHAIAIIHIAFSHTFWESGEGIIEK